MLSILAKIQSGSKLYDLETPQSDTDYYSVGLNTQLKHILGLDRHEHQISQTEIADSTCFELRRFFNLCRKSTTHAYEFLSAPLDRFEILNPEFKSLILNNKEKFMDSKNLFKCIMGYAASERRIATGEAIGRLGEKRKAEIAEFGYSRKNFTNLFRILTSGIYFYEQGFYPTSFKKLDLKFHNLLLDIKTNPQKGKKNELLAISYDLENELKVLFNGRDTNKDLIFNEEYANRVVLEFYYPVLKGIYAD